MELVDFFVLKRNARSVFVFHAFQIPSCIVPKRNASAERITIVLVARCHLSTTVRANAREPFDGTRRKENDDRLSFLLHRFNIHELSCE